MRLGSAVSSMEVEHDESRVEASAFPALAIWDDEKHKRLTDLMARLMAGEVSRGRPLKYWENLKLKPQHLQMLLMKAAGFPNRSIAMQMDMTDSRVSVIVNHPDAQVVLSYLISAAAEDMLDVKTRIKCHAGEALDTVLDTMRNTRNDAVRANTGFELLKMAGYGAVQKAEVKHTVEFDKVESQRIANTLDELRGLEGVDVEAFVEVTQPHLLEKGSEADNLQDVDDSRTVGRSPAVDSPQREVA